MWKTRTAFAVGAALLLAGNLESAQFPDEADLSVTGVPYPYSMSLGDLSNDGKLDLIVSSWVRKPDGKYDDTQSQVYLFYQKNGTFAPPPDKALAVRTPWGTAIGDFDGDGKSDLAVTQTRRYLHLFLGGEDFDLDHADVNVNHGSSSCFRRVVAGRLSPGGKADFLCGPVWRKWQGGDIFRPGYYYGPEVNDNGAALLADLNQDGHVDVIFHANVLEPRGMRLYYGPCPYQTVRPADLSELVTIDPEAPLSDVATGDLNGDGRLDLLASTIHEDPAQQKVLIYHQDAPIGFRDNAEPSRTIAGVAGDLQVADFDGDGRDDLLVCSAPQSRLCLFVQRPDGTLAGDAGEANQVISARYYASSVGDIDGNGSPDLAISDGRSAIRVFFNTSERASEAPESGQPIGEQRVAVPVSTEAAESAVPRPVQTKPTIDTETITQAIAASQAGGNPDHDPERMPYYTGAIIPTPQQVTYKDEFLALDDAEVLLGEGLTGDSPHVAVLRKRIEKYGGNLTVVASASSGAGTLIVLGDIPAAAELLGELQVPQREQGYLVRATQSSGRNVVILQGYDQLGLLWAISSFNQLVHLRDSRPVVRAAEVIDYPVIPNRGFIAGYWPDGGEYCLAFKINKPVFQGGLRDYSITDRAERARAWRRPLAEQVRQDLRRIGETLSPFGIDWYAGNNPIVGDPEDKIRSKSDDDFRVVMEWAEFLDELGGNLCLKYDDHRFPISPADKRDFGTARGADTYLLNRLCQELGTRCPEMKVLFCPPFYWGPTSPALYPEPRDDYLYAIGQLPANLETFWTGPRVKSGKVTPDMVEWITERIKRKPVYWQNGHGMPHMYGYHYMTDPVPTWRDWYYDGFYQDMDTYMLNCMMPGYCASVITCADYCWNPDAYDPDSSIEEAAKKLVGAATYPTVVKLNKALSYFDPYELRVTPGAARNLNEIAENVEAVNAVFEELKEKNLPAVAEYSQMLRHILQVNKFYSRLARTPSLAAYAEQASASLERAKAEVGFSTDTDTFLSAFDFLGGCPAKEYGNRCENRLATWIYGSRSPNPRMQATFPVEPFPPAGDYTLIISGQDDDAEEKCRIRITVNGAVVFEGENPFVRLGWSRHAFPIPAALLKRSSVLQIENIEDTSRSGGPPFFMLNYAVVRKGKAQ